MCVVWGCSYVGVCVGGRRMGVKNVKLDLKWWTNSEASLVSRVETKDGHLSVMLTWEEAHVGLTS